MARRSVVLAPPPGAEPRKAVVVRQGPPQRDRRLWVDAIMGVLGAALLIAAIILVPILPEEEVLPDQYEVAFEETVIEDTEVRSTLLAERESTTLSFPIDDPFVYRLDIAVEWLDDAPSSLADTFEFTLRDPNGTAVVGPVQYPNPEPVSDGATTPTYTAKAASRVLGWDLAPKPTTQVESAQKGEDQAAVEARVREAAHSGQTGAWTLDVTLIDAGDCPDPSGLDLNRFFTCQSTSGGAPDTQNAFQVVKVSMLRYEPRLTLLES